LHLDGNTRANAAGDSVSRVSRPKSVGFGSGLKGSTQHLMKLGKVSWKRRCR
jgi:hypothetical protein